MTHYDAAPKKPRRTRTGCLNCRRRKRKCDERRPSCGACFKKSQHCEWGVKLSFRPENAHHLDSGHLSMRIAARSRPHGYEILDMTSEVSRDYKVLSPQGRDLQGARDEPQGWDRGRTNSADTTCPNESNQYHVDSSRNTIDGGKPSSATVAETSPETRRRTENAVASLLSLSQGG